MLFFVFTVFRVGSTLLPHGRAGYKQLSGPQSKRGSMHRRHASCPGLEYLLATSVPMDACTVPRRRGRIPTKPDDTSCGGFGVAQTCRAILHCRTGHRGLIEVVDRETQSGPSSPQVGVSLPALWYCSFLATTNPPQTKRCGPPSLGESCRQLKRVPSDTVFGTQVR